MTIEGKLIFEKDTFEDKLITVSDQKGIILMTKSVTNEEKLEGLVEGYNKLLMDDLKKWSILSKILEVIESGEAITIESDIYKEAKELEQSIIKDTLISTFDTIVNNDIINDMSDEIITLEPKNSTSFNPLELDTKHETLIDIVDINLIERLKQGEFKNLLEVSELVEKFNKSSDPIANSLFNEWWKNDGSKKGLLELIKTLSL